MTDVVDAATRSRMMAGIRGKDTKPELVVRRYLHKRGLRFRLHVRNLPGAPDLVFPKHRAVVFVNGCFWHMHKCSFFKMPKTRSEFWEKKLNNNSMRDMRCIAELRENGWRVAVFWECAIKQEEAKRKVIYLDRLAKWVISQKKFIEIPIRPR